METRRKEKKKGVEQGEKDFDGCVSVCIYRRCWGFLRVRMRGGESF